MTCSRNMKVLVVRPAGHGSCGRPAVDDRLIQTLDSTPSTRCNIYTQQSVMEMEWILSKMISGQFVYTMNEKLRKYKKMIFANFFQCLDFHPSARFSWTWHDHAALTHSLRAPRVVYSLTSFILSRHNKKTGDVVGLQRLWRCVLRVRDSDVGESVNNNDDNDDGYARRSSNWIVVISAQ